MNNFAYRNNNNNLNNYNTFLQPVQKQMQTGDQFVNDERFGGAFLVPFLTGAVISAPFWYLGAQNKANQMYQQQMYYQYNNPYQNYPQHYPNYYPNNYNYTYNYPINK